jgi:hypothetical protein
VKASILPQSLHISLIKGRRARRKRPKLQSIFFCSTFLSMGRHELRALAWEHGSNHLVASNFFLLFNCSFATIIPGMESDQAQGSFAFKI